MRIIRKNIEKAARDRFAFAAVTLALLYGGALSAAEYSTDELVKETQNPVADLISVPFQNNFNFGAGGG